MSQLSLEMFRVENKLRSQIGTVLLLAVPVFIALLALAKFVEPTAPVALENAQLARHIAGGQGFTTGVLRPLALTAQPHALPVPDLVNAPLHPLLLAGVFAVTGPSTRVAAAFGLVVWLLTVWLVFLIARYWWDWRAASLAALFCVCSLTGALSAVAGLPQPMLTVLVFGAVAAVFPKPNSVREGDSVLALWQPVLAGVLCGAAILTDYRLLPLALVLGVYLFKTQERRVSALALFVGGFVLVLLPWCIRNYVVSGRVFGLYWYSALENTRQFPGETIWRLTDVPKHPLLYLLLHPWDLARKLALGLAQYQQSGLGMLVPVVLFLCAVALFGAPAKSSRRRLAGIVFSSVVLTVLLSCLTWPDARLLQAWTPLLSCVAAAQLVAWVHANVSGFSTANARLRLSTTGMRSLTYTGIVALVAFPAVMQFSRIRFNSPPDTTTKLTMIHQRLPAGGVVLTDVPAFVTWYLQRPALLLCQHEADWVELEKQTGKIAGIYLSPAVSELPPRERGNWWVWIASQRGVYRDLAMTPNSPWPGRLRLLQNMTIQMTAELELERLDNLKYSSENSQSTEAQTQLAYTHLKLGNLREAQRIFQEVSRLDRYNVTALTGQWETLAQLNESDGTLRLAQLVMQIDVHDPQAKNLLTEAAAHFEQLLEKRPSDPWLLMNLLSCRSRLGQWKEGEECYMRLAKILPETFPSRLILADLYFQEGELVKATAEIDRLVQENPNMPTAHELAGRILLAQNKLEDALREFETTARLRPQWITARVQSAQICFRLQRYDDATKHFEAALKLAPKLLPLKLSLGDLYVAQGKTAAATDLYREILAGDAHQVVALNNLATLLAKTGQAEAALPYARQAMNLAPQNPDYRLTAGWVAYLTNNQDEALLHLLEAARIAPQLGLAHFYLGKIFLAQTQSAKARQEFKRALECGLPATEKQEAQTGMAGG